MQTQNICGELRVSAENGKAKPAANTGHCSYSDQYKLNHSIKNIGRRDCGRGEKHNMQASKKNEQIEERIDKTAPQVVCIDDFATKKRYTYGTVMVDAETLWHALSQTAKRKCF